MVAEFAREKPFIFGVGIEKCGTTSVYELLRKADNISTPAPKEIGFFQSDKDLDWYLAHYDLSKDVLVDINPAYHWNGAALQRISQLSDRGLIVLMLRHPIDRAYSAYIHRIYWFFEDAYRNGKIAEFDRTFQDEIDTRIGYVVPSYVKTMDRLEGIFDKGKIIFTSLEQTISNTSRFISKLEDHLLLDLKVSKNEPLPKVNSLSVPTFMLGSEILAGNALAANLIKDENGVYICRDGMPRWIAHGDAYGDLKKLETKWTQPVDVDTSRDAFEKYYQQEVSQIEARLGEDLADWRVPKVHSSTARMPLSDAAAMANPEVALWQARTAFGRGDLSTAVELMGKLTEREDGAPEYHMTLSRMLVEHGAIDEAEEHADIAVRLAPAAGEYAVNRQYIRNRRWIGTQVSDREANGTVAEPPTADRSDMAYELVFARNDHGAEALQSGFGDPEPWGVWTIGPRAKLAIPMELSEPLVLWLEFRVFVANAGWPANFVVSVNDQPIGSFIVDSASEAEIYERAFEIPNSIPVKETVEVTLSIWNFQTVEQGTQDKEIGVGLQRLKLLKVVSPLAPMSSPEC